MKWYHNFGIELQDPNTARMTILPFTRWWAVGWTDLLERNGD